MKSSFRDRRRDRIRAPYVVLFAGSVVILLAGAVSTFRVMSASALQTIAADSAAAAAITYAAPDSSRTRVTESPVAPDRAQYTRYASEDSAWRARAARVVSVKELRARGDGRRSPRQLMEDRVYEYQRAGERARAIAELDRWVRAHPRDQDAMLTLARRLRQSGRTEESLSRYRQAMAIDEGRGGR